MKHRLILLMLGTALALTAAFGGGEAEALFQSPWPTPTITDTPTAIPKVIPDGANPVDREGSYWLRAYGRDKALNRSPVVVEPLRIDLLPPYRIEAVFDRAATSSGWYTAPLTITLTAADEISGVAERLARLDGGVWAAGWNAGRRRRDSPG